MTRIYEAKKQQGKKDDARVLRSKRDLSNALITLLDTKPYASISVKDICETALISKLCFYNNFLNKDDLIMYIFKNKTDEALKSIQRKLLNEGRTSISYEEIINALIHMYFNENGVFKKIITQDKDKTLYQTIFTYIKETIPSLISYNINRYLKDIPSDLVLSFFSGALTGLLYSLSNDEFSLENEKIADYVSVLTTSTLLSKPTI